MGATHRLKLTLFDVLVVRKGNEQLAEKLEFNDADEVGETRPGVTASSSLTLISMMSLMLLMLPASGLTCLRLNFSLNSFWLPSGG